MSDWIELYQDELINPVCSCPFTAYLMEDGNIERTPIIIKSLVGGFVICSYCSEYLTDEDLF